MSRAIVVVDVETTALQPRTVGEAQRTSSYLGEIVEVAWWNLTTGEHGYFVPPHDVDDVLAWGHPAALEKNRYRERLADADQDPVSLWLDLHSQLRGQTLAGANPAFDARWLTHAFEGAADPAPWHHRLLDVEAYAAGALGIHGHELPGLAAVCERLVVSAPDHTALGDVTAAGQALMALGAVPADAAAVTS